MAGKKPLVVAENIESRILLIRGQKVMLDARLAFQLEVTICDLKFRITNCDLK